VQTYIIHLIRNTFRLTSRKYWDEIKRDIEPIYTAANATAARSAFDQLTDKWGQRYPAVIKLWDNAWAEFIPFLDYGACCKIARRRPRAKKLDVAALQFWSPRRRSLVFREVRASRSTHGLATCRLRNRLYDVEIRSVICSTDESVNGVVARVGVVPSVSCPPQMPDPAARSRGQDTPWC
jgi:Transposase, Mutator family